MTAKQPQKKKTVRSSGKKPPSSGKKTSPSSTASAKKKAKTATKKRARQPQHSLLRALLGFVFLIGIVLATGLTVHYLFPPNTQTPPAVKNEAPPETHVQKPTYEVFPKEDLVIDETEPVPPPRAEHHPFPVIKPKVAIIIDDIGYNRVIARKLMDLNVPLTFSVLPHSPHSRKLAAEAHGRDIQIMLHLPMEPMEYPKVNPGPGALLVSMNVDNMIETLYDDLEDVPYVVGVNNHMGSRMTTVSTRMYQIFTVLKKKELFFIDSKTSPQSLCKPSARLLQVPFGERDVFLDHSLNKDTIRKQVKHLIRIAKRTGVAIGIGHPHTETYEVLFEELDELEENVRLVYASDLVRPLG